MCVCRLLGSQKILLANEVLNVPANIRALGFICMCHGSVSIASLSLSDSCFSELCSPLLQQCSQPTSLEDLCLCCPLTPSLYSTMFLISAGHALHFLSPASPSPSPAKPSNMQRRGEAQEILQLGLSWPERTHKSQRFT